MKMLLPSSFFLFGLMLLTKKANCQRVDPPPEGQQFQEVIQGQRLDPPPDRHPFREGNQDQQFVPPLDRQQFREGKQGQRLDPPPGYFLGMQDQQIFPPLDRQRFQEEKQGCQRGWLYSQNLSQCLLVTDYKLTFNEAQDYCFNMESEPAMPMVTLRYSKEVFNLAKQTGQQLSRVWIPLPRKYIQRAPFILKKKSETVNLLCPGVVLSNFSHDCIELRFQEDGTGCMADVDCNKRLYGVCQRRLDIQSLIKAIRRLSYKLN